MSLNSEQVLRIARLARIELSPAEVQQTEGKLNSILGLIAQLQAADTQGIAPMAHALEGCQRLREDRVTETDHCATYQAIAPETAAGLYLVPKVIE